MSQEETTQVAEPTEPGSVPEATADAPPTPADLPESAPLISVAEFETAKREAVEFKEGWLRERADFNNYKKRTETQMKDLRESAVVDALMNLLPIIDDLERAMANVPADMKENPWINGVGGIYRKLQKTLEDRGVAVIDPTGEVFDPNRHEAVMKEDSSEVESGHVIATLQKGYVRGDKVLRPAIVKVAN